MRTLEFKVNRQIISKQPGCDFSGLVAGSNGYLRAKFNFNGPEWEGCEKSAGFWIGERRVNVPLDENDECDIPAQVLGETEFRVQAMGTRKFERGRFSIDTNCYRVKQLPAVNKY